MERADGDGKRARRERKQEKPDGIALRMMRPSSGKASFGFRTVPCDECDAAAGTRVCARPGCGATLCPSPECAARHGAACREGAIPAPERVADAEGRA